MTIKLILAFFIFSELVFADEWKTYDSINSPLPEVKTTSICIDMHGNKWIGTADGLAVFNGSGWLLYSMQDSLADNYITDILFINSKSELWIATQNGISVFKINSIGEILNKTIYRKNNSGLISNSTLSLSQTDQVNWIGTYDGLSILKETEWGNYTRFDVLPDNVILSMVSQPDGWNYLTTRGGGVARLKYQVDAVSSASTITKQWSGLPSDTVNCALIDNELSRWFGTNYGVSKHTGDFTKENWSLYNIADGLIDNSILSIEQDSSNHMWFGTSNGLSKLENDTWHSWDKNNTLPGDSIFDIATDLDGTLWFATDSGLVHYDPGISALSEKMTNQVKDRLEISLHPNPFNLSTTLSFHLSRNENLSINIFSITGELIKKLYHNYTMAGQFDVVWNGTDNYQTEVASGIYFALIETKNSLATIKMVVLK